MASSISFIVGILFIITVANLVFLWLLYRDLLQKMKEYDRRLFELRTSSDITEAFTEEGTHEDLNKLAKELLTKVKSTFGLEGNTFSEFVTLLKDKPVKNEKLKDTLVHFFEKIVIYSYRDVTMSETDKEEMKQEYKLILNMIEEHTRTAKKK